MIGFTVRCVQEQAEFLLPALDQHQAVQPPLVAVARDDGSQTASVLIGRLHYRDEVRALLPEREREKPENRRWTGPGRVPACRDRGPAAARRRVCPGDLGRPTEAVDRDAGSLRGVAAVLVRECLRLRPWAPVSSASLMPTGAPSLNLDYVAEFLTRPFVPSEVPCEQTAFQGIQRVCPGTLVRLDAAGQAQTSRYWDWSSRIEQVPEACGSDVAERFHELLRRAVGERIDGGRVAAHLSGGMDSSSVAILAGQWLAASSESAPLLTLSLTYRAPELAGERSYVDLVLRQEKHTQPLFLQADSAVGFDWFERAIPRHDEPYVGLWSLATNALLVEAAQQHGVRTILTGVGGDEILSYRPLHIADLLRRGRCLSAFREASVWAQARGQGLWSVLHKCGLEPLWTARRVARYWPFRRSSIRAGKGGSVFAAPVDCPRFRATPTPVPAPATVRPQPVCFSCRALRNAD